jgi:hypothetical protein
LRGKLVAEESFVLLRKIEQQYVREGVTPRPPHAAGGAYRADPRDETG